MTTATPRPREAVWREIAKPGGAALGIAGTALAVVQIFILPDWKVAAQWVGALAVATLVAILWFNSALSNALDDLRLARATSAVNENQTPKVVYATINPSEENGVILLLEPHALFGQSMLVSVYSEDERGFEQFVASGIVSNIQMNGKIQVAVTGWEPAHLELQRYVASQDATRLERLIIRPAPTSNAFQLPRSRDFIGRVVAEFEPERQS